MDIVSKSEEALPINTFLFKVSNSYSNMVSIMFRGKNKNIRTTSTSSVSGMFAGTS